MNGGRNFRENRQLDGLFDSDSDVSIDHADLHSDNALDLTTNNATDCEETPEYDSFMQSQQPIEIPSSPSHQGDPNIFVRSDEELSDLDCFTSIQQLLDRGGDERRRAEFILRQFNKNTGGEGGLPAPKVRPIQSPKRRGGSAPRSLGVRRTRR